MSEMPMFDLSEANETRPKTDYVLGFLFSEHGTHVVLIEHEKFGKLNGVGGKVEPGESPYEAMAREFLEETGALVAEHEWTQFGVMSGPDYRVFLFSAHATRHVATQNEGKVDYYCVATLRFDPDVPPIMDNLSWLIPMSQDKSIAHAAVVNL